MMPFASPYGSPLYWSFHERPEAWHIDPFHQYAKQLVFFGGGRFTHSTHFHDSSLYGNHGVLTNMSPSEDWVRDLGRWALDFDGNNDYVYGGFRGATSPITLCCWGFTAIGNLNQTLVGVGRPRADGSLVIGLKNFTDLVARYNPNSGGGFLAISTVDYPLATWFHATAIFIGIDYREIYLNGVLTGTNSQSSSYPTLNQFRIGATPVLTPGSYLTGMVADPMIWSRVLSPSEISALADPGNVMLSLGGSDPGLIVPDDLVYPVYLPSSVPAGAKPALWLGVCA